MVVVELQLLKRQEADQVLDSDDIWAGARLARPGGEVWGGLLLNESLIQFTSLNGSDLLSRAISSPPVTIIHSSSSGMSITSGSVTSTALRFAIVAPEVQQSSCRVQQQHLWSEIRSRIRSNGSFAA